MWNDTSSPVRPLFISLAFYYGMNRCFGGGKSTQLHANFSTPEEYTASRLSPFDSLGHGIVARLTLTRLLSSTDPARHALLTAGSAPSPTCTGPAKRVRTYPTITSTHSDWCADVTPAAKRCTWLIGRPLLCRHQSNHVMPAPLWLPLCPAMNCLCCCCPE